MILNPALPALLPSWREIFVSFFGGGAPKAPPPPPPPPPPPTVSDAGAKERIAARGNRGRASTILAGRDYNSGEALGSGGGGGKTVLGG